MNPSQVKAWVFSRWGKQRAWTLLATNPPLPATFLDSERGKGPPLPNTASETLR